jgi:hypothetical protein
VLGRQPTTAYLHRRDSHFVWKILPQFLEHRIFALYGAPDVLPKFVKKIVDIFVSTFGDTSFERRKDWTRGVCETLVAGCKTPNAHWLSFSPDEEEKIKLAAMAGRQEALGAAITLGEADIVSALAADPGILLWIKTSTGSGFGYPLEVATRSGTIDVVKALLAVAKRETTSRYKKQQTIIFMSCMTHALQHGKDIALALLDWYLINFDRPDSYERGDWFGSACATGKLDFLSKLVSATKPAALTECARSFLSKKDRSFAGLTIPLLLTTGLFNRSNINMTAYPLGGNSLLDIAVWKGGLDIIQLVLDAGADANGVWSSTTESMSYPARTAIQCCLIDVYHLLLGYGADPNLGL